MFQALFIGIGDGLVKDFRHVVEIFNHHRDGLIIERRHIGVELTDVIDLKV